VENKAGMKTDPLIVNLLAKKGGYFDHAKSSRRKIFTYLVSKKIRKPMVLRGAR
jgi:hypothetical protein